MLGVLHRARTFLQETTPDINQTIPATPALYSLLNQHITPNIVMHMAANSNEQQLFDLGASEIESMYYKNSKKFINVYFGALSSKKDRTSFIME